MNREQLIECGTLLFRVDHGEVLSREDRERLAVLQDLALESLPTGDTEIVVEQRKKLQADARAHYLCELALKAGTDVAAALLSQLVTKLLR